MTDWLPSLNALRAFETVARHLSYPRAAEELHVTPAAVKQLVSKLEKTVGSQLIKKQGRGLVLTDPGAKAGLELTRAFRDISVAVESLRHATNSNRLIISVDPSFAAAWLVPRLQAFRQSNPQVDVLIDSSMEIVDLERGGADVAIRFAVPADPALVTRRLFDEEISVFCSPRLAAAGGGFRCLEDLEKVTLLRWDLTPFP